MTAQDSPLKYKVSPKNSNQIFCNTCHEWIDCDIADAHAKKCWKPVEPVVSPAPSKPENPYAKRKDIVTKCWQEGYEAGSKPKVPSLEQIEKILVSFIEEQDPLCNRTIGAYTTAILKLMEEGV